MPLLFNRNACDMEKRLSGKLLVDSCVFISAFDTQSQHYELSHKFLGWLVEKKLIITMPAHAWFEVLCTLRRLERNDKSFKGRSVCGNWSYPIELIHIDDAFIKKYGNVDIDYIKAGDHIFLVVAKLNSFPLITIDKKMRDVALTEKIPVFTPEEFMSQKIKT